MRRVELPEASVAVQAATRPPAPASASAGSASDNPSETFEMATVGPKVLPSKVRTTMCVSPTAPSPSEVEYARTRPSDDAWSTACCVVALALVSEARTAGEAAPAESIARRRIIRSPGEPSPEPCASQATHTRSPKSAALGRTWTPAGYACVVLGLESQTAGVFQPVTFEWIRAKIPHVEFVPWSTLASAMSTSRPQAETTAPGDRWAPGRRSASTASYSGSPARSRGEFEPLAASSPSGVPQDGSTDGAAAPAAGIPSKASASRAAGAED